MRIGSAGGAAVLIAFALVAAAGGCQPDHRHMISGETLRAKLRAELEAETGMTVTAVECPDSRPVKKGDEFNCVIRFGEDASITMKMTQTKGDGTVQSSFVEWKGLTKATRVAQQIEYGLSKSTGVQFRVDCGSGFRRTREAHLFTCTVTASDGSSVLADVTGGGEETDIQWKVREDVRPAPPTP